MKYLGATLSLLILLATPAAALADDKEAAGCKDTWPEDRARPQLTETFPLKGLSGHVAFLELKIVHLPGERVFPGGLKFGGDSDEMTRLTEAQFQVPHVTSAAKPTLTETDQSKDESSVVTVVRLPVIPLPDEAGRVTLTLPRLPISISRASGQVHTVCTEPHVITVEDPLASTANQKPKPDPDPRPQIEVWALLRDALLALLVALPVAAALVWLFLTLKKKLKKAPKPAPPRPAWEIALSRLQEIEARELLEKNEQEEFLDAVSDTLREYLGERYGFDGLESTTRETMRQLSTLAPDFKDDRVVRAILQRADLVKFARRLPSDEECVDALQEIRGIVRTTTPSAAITVQPLGLGGPPGGPDKKKKSSKRHAS